MTDFLFIINPNAGNGLAGKKWRYLEPFVKDQFPDAQIVFSKCEGDCEKISRDAAREGLRQIISVGGDGTHHEVVNGLFENKRIINEEVVIGFIPLGTGNDLTKTLGVSPKPQTAISNLRSGKICKIDLGHIELVDFNSKPTQCYFINALNIGLGGYVTTVVNKTTKIFGGRISFLIGTLRALLAFKSQDINLKFAEDERNYVVKAINISVANGKYYGGGMKGAPEALVNDGLLDFVLIKDYPKILTLINMPRIYLGTHLKHKMVWFKKIDSLEASASEDSAVPVEVDGNNVGKLPAKIICIKSAVKIIQQS